jgi:pimeloyl-ACP methyl ester carboxylesterase
MNLEAATTTMYGGLCADEYGTDDGRPTVILLHGLTFDRRIWAPIVDAVRAADPARRLVALDLPGHGGSPALPSHRPEDVAAALHVALTEAGVTSPVLVGHSMSGAIASSYAARYPAAGVVNVDQLPLVTAFAALVRELEPQLRGAQFAATWRDVFAASFHTELLPPDARHLAESVSRPVQDVVLSYWQELFDRPAEEIQNAVDESMRELAHRGIGYVLLVGRQLPPDLTDAVRARLPRARLVEWPDTGHLPHLARPGRFAELLAGTAAWAGPSAA